MSQLTSSRRLLSLIFLLLAGSLVPIALPANAQGDHGCTIASNSHVEWQDGYDYFCAGGTTASCSQCAATYEGGYTICTYDSTGRHICVDYQN